MTPRPLAERLASRYEKTSRPALAEAIAGGPEGEAAIIEALAVAKSPNRVFLTAALGDAEGEAGPAALRALIAKGGSDDEVCSAIWALARRAGVDASADLLAALDSPRWTVKSYAVLALARVGDDRAADAVFARLSKVLARARKSHPADAWSSEVVAAVCYLSRCHSPTPLANLLRKRWNHLDPEETGWLDHYWPRATTDGGPPDAEAMHRWVLDPRPKHQKTPLP